MEFAYNDNFQVSIQMAPYETLYGRNCKSPLYWDEVEKSNIFRPEIVQEMKEQVKIIRNKMVTTQSRQKNYVNKQMRDLSVEIGD